jgi:hypothetical protein
MLLLQEYKYPNRNKTRTFSCLYKNYLAFFTKEDGLCIKDISSNRLLYNRPYDFQFIANEIQLNEKFLIYRNHEIIHIHRYDSVDSNFGNSLQSIEIPFQKCFCENYLPYYTAMSLYENILCYSIDFQYRVEFSIYDLDKQSVIQSFTVGKNSDSFLTFETSTIQLQGDFIFYSIGYNKCYLYNYRTKKKIHTFETEDDIIESYLGEGFIGFRTQEEPNIEIWDLKTRTKKQNLNIKNPFFFHLWKHYIIVLPRNKSQFEILNLHARNDNVTINLDLSLNDKTQDDYMLSFRRPFLADENRILFFLKQNNGKEITKTFTIENDGTFFQYLEKYDAKKVLGTFDENIDVKLLIMEYLSFQI